MEVHQVICDRQRQYKDMHRQAKKDKDRQRKAIMEVQRVIFISGAQVYQKSGTPPRHQKPGTPPRHQIPGTLHLVSRYLDALGYQLLQLVMSTI